MYLFLLLAALVVVEYWIPRFLPESDIVFPFLGELAIYITAGLVLVRLFLRQRIVFFGLRTSLLVAAFVGCAIFGDVLNGVNPLVGVLHLRMMVRYPLLLLIALNSRMNRRQMWIVLYGFLMFAALEAILGIVHAINPIGMETILGRERLLSIGDMKAVSFEGKEGLAVGTLPRYNHFGSYMAFCFLAAFLLWWFGALNKRYWYVWGSLIVLFAAGLIMSSSGIPVVGTFCCVLMHILTNAKVRPRLSILVFGLLVGAVILVLIMRSIVDPFAFAGGEQGPLNRLFSLFGYERWDRDTQYGRVYMHRTVIPAILQSCPAFGLGLGTVGSPVTGTSAGYENAIFPRYYRADELGVPYIMRNECPLPHYISDSGWLSLFAQTGIVGIALYGLILVQAGWYLWHIHRVTSRQEDRVSAGWSAAAFYGFLLFVICGFVTAGYIHRYYLQMCCFFCAMSMTATPRNPPPNPVDSLKPVDFGEPSEK